MIAMIIITAIITIMIIIHIIVGFTIMIIIMMIIISTIRINIITIAIITIANTVLLIARPCYLYYIASYVWHCIIGLEWRAVATVRTGEKLGDFSHLGVVGKFL